MSDSSQNRCYARAMPEHAIAIARVSTTRQDEEDQRPGLTKYAANQGYILDQVVPIHGKSAFHGRHVKDVLAAVDAYVKNGKATVVIFRHVDRTSRQGVFKGIDLLNKIMAMGARVEFSEQEYLNSNPGLIGFLMDVAEKESQVKRDRKLQGNTVKRTGGQLIGGVPWGYDPVYGMSLRTGKEVRIGIKPNALGRKWIPVIFDWAINGKSVNAIKRSLDSVPAPRRNGLWDYRTVRRIIASTTYYGVMPNNPNMTFEALISVNIWKQANAAIDASPQAGRRTVKNDPPLVRPVCAECHGVNRDGCPSGASPMYRIDTVNKWGKWSYYRCSGTGYQRKGCGARLVPADALDKLIDEVMAGDDRPRVIRVPVSGDDNDERRAVIGQKIAAAVAAGDFMLVGELSQEAMQIGPTEHVSRIEELTTGRTIGQHWQTLTRDEKRDELTNWTILAKAGVNGQPKVRLTWRSPWQTS